MIQARIIKEILAERKKQDKKWGKQNHIPSIWTDILMEEVGEVSEAILEATFGDWQWERYREELIQVAAVAIAAIEAFDRKQKRDADV